ncbi:MAG: endonuclease III [Alphaproteobacteria bacterium]|nr:endonuclease III [Alphaproteobacteria bacterium]
MRKKSEILEIMEVFKQNNPTPRCELNYCNAYTLLVAVILSAQSTDKGVNRATEALFKVADTPQKMLELGEEKLISHIRTIGLFNNKAKNIMTMSKDLVKRFAGQVPATREELESLAGVGRKTANVVLNVWYNKPALAVDTHVMRISHRLEFSQGKTPLAVELDLLKVLPDEYVINANHWFVLFGRYICKAQRPECNKCPIAKYCRCSDKKLK